MIKNDDSKRYFLYEQLTGSGGLGTAVAADANRRPIIVLFRMMVLRVAANILLLLLLFFLLVVYMYKMSRICKSNFSKDFILG
jgi:hypothetical protein